MNHKERPDVSPAEILGQALALFKANWRTYFAWCLLPFLGVAAGLLSLMLREKLPNKLMLPGMLLLLGCIILTIPLSIQIYRHALLGEHPKGWLVTRFFTRRTWGYIGNSILIELAKYLLGLAVCAVLLIVGRWAITTIGLEKQSVLWAVFDKDFIGGFIGIAGFVLLVDKAVLVYSDAALDGPVSWAEIGGRSKGAKWPMVKVMALVWALPITYIVLLQLIVTFQWNIGRTAGLGLLIVFTLGYGASYIFNILAASVLYSRLMMPAGPKSGGPGLPLSEVGGPVPSENGRQPARLCKETVLPNDGGSKPRPSPRRPGRGYGLSASPELGARG